MPTQRIIINRDNDESIGTQQRNSLLVNMDEPTSPTLPQPQLSNSINHSCAFNASEPSSGASSRNPSPVSIISSSASSSIGSTTAADSENRYVRHYNQQIENLKEISIKSANMCQIKLFRNVLDFCPYSKMQTSFIYTIRKCQFLNPCKNLFDL